MFKLIIRIRINTSSFRGHYFADTLRKGECAFKKLPRSINRRFIARNKQPSQTEFFGLFEAILKNVCVSEPLQIGYERLDRVVTLLNRECDDRCGKDERRWVHRLRRCDSTGIPLATDNLQAASKGKDLQWERAFLAWDGCRAVVEQAPKAYPHVLVVNEYTLRPDVFPVH